MELGTQGQNCTQGNPKVTAGPTLTRLGQTVNPEATDPKSREPTGDWLHELEFRRREL